MSDRLKVTWKHTIITSNLRSSCWSLWNFPSAPHGQEIRQCISRSVENPPWLNRGLPLLRQFKDFLLWTCTCVRKHGTWTPLVYHLHAWRSRCLCYNCLGQHSVSGLVSLERQLTTDLPSSATSESSQWLESSHLSRSPVLLATLQMFISSDKTAAFKIRALIDTRSELSFISEHVVTHLRLTESYSKVPLLLLIVPPPDTAVAWQE